MRVRCIAEKLTAEQQQMLTVKGIYLHPRQSYAVSMRTEYVVFALQTWKTVPYVKYIDDMGALLSAPLMLFEVIDARLSKYWRVRHDEDGDLIMQPESFHANDSYALDLYEGVPAVVADFRALRERIEAEDREDAR